MSDSTSAWVTERGLRPDERLVPFQLTWVLPRQSCLRGVRYWQVGWMSSFIFVSHVKVLNIFPTAPFSTASR